MAAPAPAPSRSAEPSATSPAAALAARLDRLPVTRFHWKLLLLAGFGWMFDAMDILIIASVAAAAAGEWVPGSGPEVNAARANVVALVTASNTAGLFFGALIAGWLADRIGRKAVFQGTLLIYSIFTGLSALAPNAETLAILRFLAGLGLGGELPVAAALMSEFAPAKQRGFLVVLLESFWAYGAVLAALVGTVVIAKLGFGWRAAMIIGALPVFYLVVLRRAMPESPRLLVSQGRMAEAEAVVRDVERQSGVEPGPGTIGQAAPATVARTAVPGTSARLAALFSGPYRTRTIVLWAMWATMNFSYYGIFLWLPSQFRARGFSLDDALTFNLIIAVAQVPGYFSAAWLVERLGRKWTLATYLFGAAIGAYFFGQVALAASDVPAILIWGSVISFFNLGAWGVVYTYTPELYPTWLRGTGSGWAAGFGRAFAFIAQLSPPLLIALTGATEGAFLVFMAVMVLGALVVLAIGPETRGRTLEEAAGA